MRNEDLIRAYDAGETLKFLFFWGHTPKQADVIDKSCLSQWFPSPFAHEGHTYLTAEHWMMARKAELFQDEEMVEKIIQSETPGEAKKLGRQVKNFDPGNWDAHKFDLVVKGNILKFTQNEAMGHWLRQTGHRILVEASPVDYIWGIGMAADHQHIHNPHHWQGENLLGYALMEVREQLMS